tara:strand:- start:5115 stop:5663 length:549 start_codon:yes stop_codon:yes gene_type:complete
MCEPTTIIVGSITLGQIATAASIAGMAMSAYGAYQGSEAKKDTANYQAGVARNNKIISDRNAAAITKQGVEESNRYRAKVRQMEANQMVGLVGQGVDLTEGSSIDLLADTAGLGEFDAQVIESNANREAYNAKVQGMNYESQAGLYKAKANAQSPAFAAGTSLLSSAGQVSDRWKSTAKAKK